VNARNRPARGGPAEITRSGDSDANRSKHRAVVARLISRSILLDPRPYGATPDDDLTVRLHAARAVINGVPGLTHDQRAALARSLPWDEAVQLVHASAEVAR
jgi:hypothetical protein